MCIEDGKDRAEEQEGTIVPEQWKMQETGMETCEVLRKVPGGSHEDTEDQGEGLGGLSAVDKGKGKEVQEEEETLQEE